MPVALRAICAKAPGLAFVCTSYNAASRHVPDWVECHSAEVSSSRAEFAPALLENSTDQYARVHCGSLKVYSEAGCGSTFRMLFPSMRGEVEDSSVTATAPVWKGSGTILVVDDEPAVRRTVARMLELMGFTTLQAADGEEGIAIFRERGTDVSLVMLDLSMPRLDGEQTYAELRRLDPEVRVVLMSGFNQQEAIARFIGKGLASFVQKPFSLESLRSCVQRVFTAPG